MSSFLGDVVIRVFLRGNVSVIVDLGDGVSVAILLGDGISDVDFLITVVSLSYALGTVASELLGNISPVIVILVGIAFELIASDVTAIVVSVDSVDPTTVVLGDVDPNNVVSADNNSSTAVLDDVDPTTVVSAGWFDPATVVSDGWFDLATVVLTSSVDPEVLVEVLGNNVLFIILGQ